MRHGGSWQLGMHKSSSSTRVPARAREAQRCGQPLGPRQQPLQRRRAASNTWQHRLVGMLAALNPRWNYEEHMGPSSPGTPG